MSHSARHITLDELGTPVRRPVEKVITRIVQREWDGSSAPMIVAVGGPGGTGKSTLADKLAAELPDSAVLNLDNYKTDRQKRREKEVFGPHPHANRLGLIRDHLKALKDGDTFQMPIYNGGLGHSDRTETYKPVRFNIVEGEVSTYRDFREFVDLSLFIDSAWRTQLKTRLGRDLSDRDYSLDKAVSTFLHSNLREFTEHGAESKSWSDMHLFCEHDYRLRIESVSEHIYDIADDLLHEDLEDLRAEGLIVALLTPFNNGGDDIDRRAFAEHLDYLHRAGVRRVLVGGTTGEFFSLVAEERLELLKLALEYFPGLIFFQAGCAGLKDTVSLASRAEELGADGIFCLPPFYLADAEENGVMLYLRTVSRSTDVPLILYNFPRHTGVSLSPAVLDGVQHDGLKDSSVDFSLIDHTPRYFVGGDASIVDSAVEGAQGFVSGVANVTPELYVHMETALREDDSSRARELQEQIAAGLKGTSIPRLKEKLSGKLPEYPVCVRPPLTNEHDPA
ncbi:MAG: dihydrodipicolinate synthase family protein [Planctomycetota bacterium]